MKYNTKETFKIYIQHAKKVKGLVFVIFLCSLFATILGDLITPLFYKHFFDTLIKDVSFDVKKALLIGILFKILFLSLITRGLWALGDFLSSKSLIVIMRDIFQSCFEYTHKHAINFFNNNFVGSLVKQVNRFAWAFSHLWNTFFWDFIPLVIAIVGICIVLSTQNLLLAGIIFLWILILCVSTFFYSRVKLPLDVALSASDSEISGRLADSFTNHENVKFLNGFVLESKSFWNTTTKWHDRAKKSWYFDAWFRVFQGGMLVGLQIGILYFAILLWEKGVFTVGDFALIQAYFVTLSFKIWELKHIIRSYYEQTANAEEMTKILLTPHEIEDKRKAEALSVTDRRIIFKNASFAYHKTRKIINKLNLEIHPHERIALVGHSGAGKSTIVKLLMRQYELTSGKIFIDDQSIDNVTQESLWASMSLVPQDPILFHRTLIENIRYGRPEASDEEVIEAARLAHAHEFISEFPEGYDTYVGERGVKLSGGERQRVAIARAILRNAPILILDEATSSLDSESESLIQDALDNLMKEKTVIVIAHRLSTIMKMDRILVLEKGTVVEEGTHKSLLRKKNGIYKGLWTLQAGGFID